jgi:hypothetical protein
VRPAAPAAAPRLLIRAQAPLQAPLVESRRPMHLHPLIPASAYLRPRLPAALAGPGAAPALPGPSRRTGLALAGTSSVAGGAAASASGSGGRLPGSG